MKIDYEIIDFFPETGSIEVYMPQLGTRLSIDVPIENNEYYTGDTLDSYIQGFLPVHSLIRLESVAHVTNSDELEIYSKTDKNDPGVLAANIRRERDLKLAETDQLVLPDIPNTEEAKKRFIEYRQLLRDIPQQPGFPFEVEWPEIDGEWPNHPDAKQYNDFINSY